MKEPTKHLEIESDYGSDDPVCAEDGDNWPCKTWRKWTASKDYRIARLEAAVKALQVDSNNDASRIEALERTVREDSNILRNGIFRAVKDMGAHGRVGNLGLEWIQDAQDFTALGDGHAVRVATGSDLSVVYDDVEGRTWTNGKVTEQRG